MKYLINVWYEKAIWRLLKLHWVAWWDSSSKIPSVFCTIRVRRVGLRPTALRYPLVRPRLSSGRRLARRCRSCRLLCCRRCPPADVPKCNNCKHVWSVRFKENIVQLYNRSNISFKRIRVKFHVSNFGHVHPFVYMFDSFLQVSPYLENQIEDYSNVHVKTWSKPNLCKIPDRDLSVWCRAEVRF